MASHHRNLIEENEDFLSIHPQRFSWFRFLFLFLIPTVSTGGFFGLLCYWFPKLYCFVTHSPVNDVNHATKILLHIVDAGWDLEPLERLTAGNQTLLMFKSRCSIFIFDHEAQIFRLSRFDTSLPFETILSRMSEGVDTQTAQERGVKYGTNLIEIHVKSLPELLITEAIHPFYIFQLFSCILWFVDEYVYYASAIVFLSSLSIGWTVYYTRTNLLSLQAMAQESTDCTVYRTLRTNPQGENTTTQTLVPGDVIEIISDMKVMCDLILLSGECVLNESTLTGESIPILKQALPSTDAVFNIKAHKKHVLFGGTTVLNAKTLDPRRGVKGLVIRTGYQTSKGQLFKSILFPKPLKFRFYTDSYKFLAIMVTLGVAGLIKSLVDQINNDYSVQDSIYNSLDLITIVVPPALPLVMTLGIGIAFNRLKNQDIFCTSPPRINFAGKVNCMCCDKTGTLTEENLDIDSLQPCSSARLEERTKNVRGLGSDLLEVLVSAHSLAVIKDKLSGHPVDMRMFEHTKWIMAAHPGSRPYQVLTLYQDPDSNKTIEVLRRFEFEASLQRMSCLIHTSESDAIKVVTKGAPEAVARLCRPETVPNNLSEILRLYGRDGYYVLGCASRVTDYSFQDVDSVTRDQVERDLTFWGLLILENRLKPETTPVLQELKRSHISSVMITGDNLFTGVSVAKKCEIITPHKRVLVAELVDDRVAWRDLDDFSEHDPITNSSVIECMADQAKVKPVDPEFELAVSADTLPIIFASENVEELLRRIRVYARTTPEQKTSIVEKLIDIGAICGMIGDGTNDCGALRVAHMGISLSDAEASVVAPFTDRKKSVNSIRTLIREGRCALVTSFTAFKFMMLYPVIQYFAVLRLYEIGLVLGDLQYLYQDLALVLPLSITMLYTGPAGRLSKRRPTANLFSFGVLFSLFMQVAYVMITLVVINELLAAQSWFVKFDEPEDQEEYSVLAQETTVTFFYSNLQYIVVALAFSSGPPFRKNFWTNWYFVLNLILSTFATIGIIFLTGGGLYDELELDYLKKSFKGVIVLVFLIHLAVALFSEFVILEGPIGNRFRKHREGHGKELPVSPSKQELIEVHQNQTLG